MNPIIKKTLKSLFQYRLTGHIGRFKLLQISPVYGAIKDPLGLYLHIPFCKNLCPYCPYNRIEYDEDLALQYEKGVIKEIDLVYNSLNRNKISSLYIGGGTPTTMLNGLINILNHLKLRFDLSKSDICIELAPNDMSFEMLNKLKDNGISMISIGVETFKDTLNENIGRKMKVALIKENVIQAMVIGFDSVNIDLMFVLPGQSCEDLIDDLHSAFECGVHQISTYPLFAFPYTDLGKSLKIKTVTRPSGKSIRKMLKIIEEECSQNGYKRGAVWSFIKDNHKKYSSVNRHSYRGFGASAGSMLGQNFHLNTFDVVEYIQKLQKDDLPIALSLPLSIKMEMAYWFYWRVYDMHMNKTTFNGLFSKDFDKNFGDIISILKLIGFARETETDAYITEKGAYWVHRIQNEYSLNNIHRIWGSVYEPLGRLK